MFWLLNLHVTCIQVIYFSDLRASQGFFFFLFPFRLYKVWAWPGKNIWLYSVVDVRVELKSVNTECCALGYS